MIENKKYQITFTNDIEVTFYDKYYNDSTRLFKSGETITATFIGVNASNEQFRDFRSGKQIFSISACTFDSVRVAPKSKKKVAMKQVTVVLEIAIAMEVPVSVDDNAIKVIVKNSTTWDVNCEHPDANMIDVSDVLGITSITEAEID